MKNETGDNVMNIEAWGDATGGYANPVDGKTILDEFAQSVVSGYMARAGIDAVTDPDEYAKSVFAIASAMVAERLRIMTEALNKPEEKA
jgi:hypothetical protein